VIGIGPAVLQFGRVVEKVGSTLYIAESRKLNLFSVADPTNQPLPNSLGILLIVHLPGSPALLNVFLIAL
jgi:hypothetical protein